MTLMLWSAKINMGNVDAMGKLGSNNASGLGLWGITGWNQSNIQE